MTPDDPRHGTTYGWKLHRLAGEETCGPCRAAVAEYEYKRSIDAILGRARVVPTHGVRRRVEALQAIGWSLTTIGEHMGMTPAVLQKAMTRSTCSRAQTLQRAIAAYEALSMSVPSDPYANRRRIIAARKGYLPPLAWDDIDSDPEPSADTDDAEEVEEVLDEVAIGRRLAGDKTAPLTKAERAEVVRVWAESGRSRNSCELVTGVPFWRYYLADEVAA